MTKIQYIEKRFNKGSVYLIDLSNKIIEEYLAMGYDLTLRQLYYQLVARDIIENSKKSYKRLGVVISDARKAGLISWTAIVDRTRNLSEPPAWDAPSDILHSAYSSYAIDLWEDQQYRVECWVEKDALRGVIHQIARRLNVPDFSCRGYSSDSEMWSAANRISGHIDNMQMPIIIHLGDHDPSGIDMTRDIIDRLKLFTGRREGEYADFYVIRAALNIEQVEEHNPPPNFAKETDSRFEGYMSLYGDESWELDALNPMTLDQIITTIVERYRDNDLFEQKETQQDQERESLKQIWLNYKEITKWMKSAKNGVTQPASEDVPVQQEPQREKWGAWECPVCGELDTDPESVTYTSCGSCEESVELGPVKDDLTREATCRYSDE